MTVQRALANSTSASVRKARADSPRSADSPCSIHRGYPQDARARSLRARFSLMYRGKKDQKVPRLYRRIQKPPPRVVRKCTDRLFRGEKKVHSNPLKPNMGTQSNSSGIVIALSLSESSHIFRPAKNFLIRFCDQDFSITFCNYNFSSHLSS